MTDESAINVLNELCASNHINKLKQQDAVRQFVLPGIALRNQITMICGPPGIGKTAVITAMLKNSATEGLINPGECIVFNCDDNPGGILDKQKILEPFGIQILSPDIHNMHPNEILRLLIKLLDEGDAAGKVFVFDTIKKFNNMMSKFNTKEFFMLCRRLSANGATCILIGHTNKNRDSNGQLVFEGTGDVLADTDCVFMMDFLEEN